MSRRCVVYQSDEQMDRLVADGEISQEEADIVKEFAEVLRTRDQD